MERFLLIALCLLMSALGCAPSNADRAAPESSSAEIAVGDEETGEEETDETPQEAAEAPAGDRLALTQCEPENRPQACTKDYRPVCAEVDNGVRCIKAPCPSTEQREFSNGCTACSDAKTVGYWPVPCAQLTTTAP